MKSDAHGDVRADADMTDQRLSSLTADQLAETVRELDSYDITVPGYEDALAALAELVGRLKTAEDALELIERGPDCICYPGMCPQGCEPACPKCMGKDDGSVERSLARAALAAIRPNPKP